MATPRQPRSRPGDPTHGQASYRREAQTVALTSTHGHGRCARHWHGLDATRHRPRGAPVQRAHHGRDRHATRARSSSSATARSTWWRARRATSWSSGRSPRAPPSTSTSPLGSSPGSSTAPGSPSLSRARVVMSVPSLATPIERRALRQAAVQAGAREVSLIEAPIAAAIGLGLPVQDPRGLGGDVARRGRVARRRCISLGGIVTAARGATGATTSTRRSRRCCVNATASWSPRRSSRSSSVNLASALGRTRGQSRGRLARTVDSRRARRRRRRTRTWSTLAVARRRDRRRCA